LKSKYEISSTLPTDKNNKNVTDVESVHYFSITYTFLIFN
jgi:hypothetical protein